METFNKVFVKRRFHCNPVELFPYLIQPELVTQWFGPKGYSVGMVESDIHVGGRYSIELKGSHGEHFFVEGEFIEISAPHILKFSLKYRGLPSSSPQSLVKITLSEFNKNESLLTLVQDFELEPPDMERRTNAWLHMFQVLDAQISPR